MDEKRNKRKSRTWSPSHTSATKRQDRRSETRRDVDTPMDIADNKIPTVSASSGVSIVSPPTSPTASPSIVSSTTSLSQNSEAKRIADLRSAVHQQLKDFRRNKAIAPHTNALKNHRLSKDATGFKGQKAAHDVLRQTARDIADMSTPDKPIRPLFAALQMSSAQLHVTLPASDLKQGLQARKANAYSLMKAPTSSSSTHSESKESSKPTNVIKDKGLAAFTQNIHGRREQVKINWHAASEHLSEEERALITPPSPIRKPFNEEEGNDGSYIPEFSLFDHKRAGKKYSTTQTVESQRQLARDVMKPLYEPSATGPNDKRQAFINKDIVEVRDQFMLQTGHEKGVASEATASYLLGQHPDDTNFEKLIRVDAVPSDQFHKVKKKNKKQPSAGLHEVIPTDEHKHIMNLPDHSRPAIAYAQADVRTNTAFTIFRGVSATAPSSSSSSSSPPESPRISSSAILPSPPSSTNHGDG